MTDRNRDLDAGDIDTLLARDDDPRQLHPDTHGYVLQVSGATKGFIKIADQKLTFLWAAESAAWPSQFQLVATSEDPPSVEYDEVYEHETFPSTTTSVDVSTCDYKLMQGTTHVGYLRRRSNGLDWYATSAAPVNGYFTTATLTFTTNSDTGTQSLRHIDAAAL